MASGGRSEGWGCDLQGLEGDTEGGGVTIQGVTIRARGRHGCRARGRHRGGRGDNTGMQPEEGLDE
eukprot:8780516-Pyramimonas_sp.AAC.1